MHKHHPFKTKLDELIKKSAFNNPVSINALKQAKTAMSEKPADVAVAFSCLGIIHDQLATGKCRIHPSAGRLFFEIYHKIQELNNDLPYL